MHLSEGHPLVYLYYGNKDQLRTQDQQFRNRTSLFKDQLSRGNASLQLTGVQVQDEGRYSCYISTINTEKDSFINLKVHTPVKVSIQHVGNRITCSSEGIYPEPELTWSTRPPSKVSFKNTTTVEQTKQQLYNINGSLIASLNETDRVYSCTVSTQRNRRRASLRQLRNTYMTIIAITAGVVVLICILSSVCLVLYCRRKRGQQENSMTASESGEPNI
uniref:Ig-like domain-containing protein n=1 Tax=Oreochromis aureus TaxID=47969 RepID=A0AAZ1WXD5_OREAU